MAPCYDVYVPRNESTPDELAEARGPRVIASQLDRQERYVALLRQAGHVQPDLGYGVDTALEEVFAQAESELLTLRARAGGRIVSRKRPFQHTDPPKCTIYIDECGQHTLGSKDEFGAFVLAAVIIPDDDYPRIDRLWKQWKSKVLGSSKKKIHEPDVRKGKGPFWFGGKKVESSKARGSLRDILGELDFTVIVCVVNRSEYVKEFGVGPMDASLPFHPYLMAVDFVMERVVMALESSFDGATASVIAESRGPLEDAIFQDEYVRLLIDGTSYISPAWFRQQLAPGVAFKGKDDNITGLELADLAARPCGEKLLAPESSPDFWPIFREKLCSGQETEHSILGFKAVPWDQRYEGLWEKAVGGLPEDVPPTADQVKT